MAGGSGKDEELACGTGVPQDDFASNHGNPSNSPAHIRSKRDEQILSEYAVISDNVYSFDRRPGVFDAARGIAPGIVVYGHRPDLGAWRVQVAQRGVMLMDLDPETARAIAAELIAYAEICDQGNGDASDLQRFDYRLGDVHKPSGLDGPCQVRP